MYCVTESRRTMEESGIRTMTNRHFGWLSVIPGTLRHSSISRACPRRRTVRAPQHCCQSSTALTVRCTQSRTLRERGRGESRRRRREGRGETGEVRWCNQRRTEISFFSSKSKEKTTVKYRQYARRQSCLFWSPNDSCTDFG